MLAGRLVVRASELLPALDEAAAAADRTRMPIDAPMAAFIAARVDPLLAGDLTRLTSFANPADRLRLLRLFARLQGRLNPVPLPGLAGWLITGGLAGVEDWRSHRTRAVLQQRLLHAAGEGQIGTMVAILDDEAARAADKAGADRAAARLGLLQAELQRIGEEAPHRAQAAHMLGQEIVTGAGLLASLGAAVALAVR